MGQVMEHPAERSDARSRGRVDDNRVVGHRECLETPVQIASVSSEDWPVINLRSGSSELWWIVKRGI